MSSDPTGKRVLAELTEQLDRERLVSDLSAMIEIPSINPVDEDARPGFREREIGEYYQDRMSDLGLNVGSRDVVPGRPNVWGVLKGTGGGPALMLSGHLDTVGTGNYPDALKAKIEGGRVYGRGACDMKGALAGYLEVVRLIREAGIRFRGDLILTGIADEEHLMIGSRDLGAHGPWADYGIIGEPTDMAICPVHKGQLVFQIRTFGKAVHSSQPEKGVNAIAAISRVIEAIQEYGAELLTREAHPMCGHARATPSVIRGGTIASTVPDFCELEVDRRTLPGESTHAVIAEYRHLLDRLARTTSGFVYEISGPTLDVAPLDVPLDNPIVTSVAGAYRDVLARESTVHAFPGGTDAPNFGFPTVIFGPGTLAQAHSTDEYVEVDDLIAATKIYLRTALDLLGP